MRQRWIVMAALLVVSAVGAWLALGNDPQTSPRVSAQQDNVREASAQADLVPELIVPPDVAAMPELAGSDPAEASERARAMSELMEAERSWQNQLPAPQVRLLAEQGDAIAQEVMAVKFTDLPQEETLRFALMAASAGRPLGAIVAADTIAQYKHDPAEGLLLLDSYEEKHGRSSALIARYREKFARIHALTEQEILSDYRLLKSNKQRGAPQKYSLTAPTEVKAPAHPAPP